MFQVYFDQEAVDGNLNAPVVELATFFSVPVDFRTGAGELLGIIGALTGY
jgi:hypothetical protein